MFAMIEPKPHLERRRMLTNVYTKTYIQGSPELTNILNTMLSERLLPQMRRWAETGREVDVHRENKAFIMDCGTAYIFGLGNGTNFIQKPEEKALLRDFELGISGLFWFTEAPSFVRFITYVGMKLVRDEVIKSFQAMEDLCLKMSEKARLMLQHGSAKVRSAHPTVYTQLCKKLEEAKNSPDTINNLAAAELLDHTQAGPDPAGITLTYLMAELSQDPAARHRLREELRNLQRKDAIWSSPRALDDLPYLDAVLMETMRLHPGALGPFPRLVPSNGTTLGRFSNIPQGTTVSTSAYSLHRNPSVFPEPERWRPERWVDSSVEARKEMQKWFWVFGSGSRMCIGSHLAMRSKSYSYVESALKDTFSNRVVVMKSFIAAVYSEFDISLVDGKIPPQTDAVIAYPEGHTCLVRFQKIQPVLV